MTLTESIRDNMAALVPGEVTPIEAAAGAAALIVFMGRLDTDLTEGERAAFAAGFLMGIRRGQHIIQQGGN